MARATFAAQAQDGIEDTFRQLAGVTSTRLGFVAGSTGQGATAAVEVRFNPAVTSYTELLEVYWRLLDPRLASGHPTGTVGARLSVVFYHDNDQRGEAIATKIRLERSGQMEGAIVTDILPATPWLDLDAMLPPGSLGAGSSAESQAGEE